MSKTFIMVPGGLLLCAILLCSCASSPQKPGPAQTVQESWGTKAIYKDASGQIVRIEKRGTNDVFLPGACVVQFTYDTNGERVAKQNLNSEGSPVCNNEGYAVTKYAFPADRPVVEETFYDLNNQPVTTKSGFAMMTCTENPDGGINTIYFSDLLKKPAPSLWHGVSNVVDVQYYYLQGVTPIVCGVFRDANGNILDRKQLKGLTSQVTQVTFQVDDDSDYDVPTHVHIGESHHDGGSYHDGGFHGGHH